MTTEKTILATTFTRREVEAFLQVANALHVRGADLSVVARSKSWSNLVGKFQRLGAKAEKKP